MIRTRVGYAGGKEKNPTYRQMKDHTEVFEVDYDPEVLDYEDLLNHFWTSHNPTANSFSRQYRSVILYHSPEQKKIALKSMAAEEKRRGALIKTSIEPMTTFTYAEDYHQKYTLRRHDILEKEMKAFFGNGKAFTNSSTAMRLNAALGGKLNRKKLLKELPQYGLSPKAITYLKGKLGLNK